jgi:excisionase family DNA binding protein
MVLLNPSEAAKELRLSPCTIYRLVASGKVPCHRISKKIFFTPQDIEQYLSQCVVPTAEMVAPNEAKKTP